MVRYVVGLGNPGPDYVFTRHNAGFLFLDRIVEREKCREWSDEGEYLISNCAMGSRDVFLIKPATFMNLSGIAIDRLVRKRGPISPSDILLVYDDVWLPLGKLRIRKSGSDGGHNGVRSILSVLGTDEVPRIRIGIGPKPQRIRLADFVLSEFSDEELRILYRVLDLAVEALSVIIVSGIEKAMSLYNSAEVVP